MSSRSETDLKRQRQRYGFLCVLLVVLTLAVYWQATGFNFTHYDDNYYVSANPEVQAGLTVPSIVWAFTHVHANNWHPVTWISHMLDWELGGSDPYGHHLTSVLIHTVNALILFLILSRLTGWPWRSAFVAALFAVHPLHVESVAWIAERKDVLSTFFLLLTIWAYARYVARPVLRRYLAVVAFLALGLMSKPMLVTAPFVLLLLDWWPLGRLGTEAKAAATWRSLVREKAPMLVLAAGSAVATLVVQWATGAVGALEKYPLDTRVANALVSYIMYMWKMIWPSGLACLYPYPAGGLPLWQSAASAAALVVVSYSALKLGRRAPWFAVGWFWYLITLVPVIGLVQVGQQSMADRYTYVPLIGLFIVVAWGVPALIGAVMRDGLARRAVLAVLAACVTLALAADAHKQASYWRNDFTLFERALAVTRNNAVAQFNLGRSFLDVGDLDEAIPHFREAVRIDHNKEEAHTDLAAALLQLGRTDEALKHFRESARIRPRDAVTRSNLAVALMSAGKIDEAIREFTVADRLRPGDERIRGGLEAARAMKEAR